MEDLQDLDAFTEAEGRQLLAAAFETVPAGTVLAGNGLAGNGLADVELLRRVRWQTSRRRRVRTLVPAGAVAALGGAVALGVTLTASVAGAPSALAAVTAAAAKTSADSFSVTERISQSGYDKPGPPQITGVFDHRHGLGEEIVNGRTQVRFVGGHMYMQIGSKLEPGKSWMEGQLPPPLSLATGGQPFTGAPGIAEGFNGSEPIDPGALLGLLKSAGSVQAEGPASGPGWTGTKYAFALPRPKFTHGKFSPEGGTVYVDSQGRVRRLVTTIDHQPPVGNAIATYDVTFGGFGVRVSVTAPPASQVYNLGKSYMVIIPGPTSSWGVEIVPEASNP
jgi:hypothetical protein